MTWERLAGQERAVALLRRAAERPVHAYLLVGARGSGVEDAARCFAAALVAPEDDVRAVDLALRGMHPDIVEFEPEGANYRVKEDVRERIIPEASRSPIEGARKVIVLFEAERLVFARRTESANALLKTIEEPPPRTVMLLVTATPDELPDTVRSRCQRVDLVPLAETALREALEHEGVPAERAALAIVRWHLSPGSLYYALERGELDPRAYVNAVRKVLKRIHPVRWQVLLAACEGDWRGRAIPGVETLPYAPGLSFARAVESERLDESPPVPLVLGRDVLALGVPPGPEVGRIIRDIEDARDRGEIVTRDEALDRLHRIVGGR